MSYYNDLTKIDENIKINGVPMPETSVPPKISFNNISDGGRLADSLDFEGELQGVKVNIELHYNQLNKEHYDLLFNATQGAYLNKKGFFMEITVPTHTPLGVQTYRGYFMSTHEPNCVDTNEKDGYKYGSEGYDEWHEDVTFSFVQK